MREQNETIPRHKKTDVRHDWFESRGREGGGKKSSSSRNLCLFPLSLRSGEFSTFSLSSRHALTPDEPRVSTGTKVYCKMRSFSRLVRFRAILGFFPGQTGERQRERTKRFCFTRKQQQWRRSRDENPCLITKKTSTQSGNLLLLVPLGLCESEIITWREGIGNESRRRKKSYAASRKFQQTLSWNNYFHYMFVGRQRNPEDSEEGQNGKTLFFFFPDLDGWIEVLGRVWLELFIVWNGRILYCSNLNCSRNVWVETKWKSIQ